ncbi:MAG: zinc-ribbon domain-containing protein [Treponema sp.]|nr:zinc-ribbon domain-containing protein [Treponema sp.]
MGARFFCEHCGAEVKRNSKICPQCGRSFEHVFCPACGFIGEGSLFSSGCPVCGYTAGSPAAPKSKTGKTPSQKFAAAPPPAWAYLLAVLALVGVLALLFRE